MQYVYEENYSWWTIVQSGRESRTHECIHTFPTLDTLVSVLPTLLYASPHFSQMEKPAFNSFPKPSILGLIWTQQPITQMLEVSLAKLCRPRWKEAATGSSSKIRITYLGNSVQGMEEIECKHYWIFSHWTSVFLLDPFQGSSLQVEILSICLSVHLFVCPSLLQILEAHTTSPSRP